METSDQEEENQEMPDFNPEDEEAEEEAREEEMEDSSTQEPRPSRETRKDKDLNTFLNSMDKYAPIV